MHKNCGKVVEKSKKFKLNFRNFWYIRQLAQILVIYCKSLKINQIQKVLKTNELQKGLTLWSERTHAIRFLA